MAEGGASKLQSTSFMPYLAMKALESRSRRRRSKESPSAAWHAARAEGQKTSPQRFASASWISAGEVSSLSSGASTAARC
eukprot:9500012-Pyramimonas_sp.AAC.1